MISESLAPFLQWIGDHPTWSGIAVFLISLSESLAIVGLVVPGVVMMTAIGGMMGAGILPFWETLAWAVLGAVAGDGISYWLGYHFHAHLRDFWPFNRYPQLLARGETFFKKHGGKSIILGRFIGPVRPMIPVIAGMMDMKPRTFLFFNIVSAIAWAPLYSLPGILIGASLGTLSPHVASRVGLFILLFLLFLWILYSFVLKLITWIVHIISLSLQHAWQKWQASHRFIWLHKSLATAQGTEEGQLGTFLLFIISLSIFIWSLFSVIHSNGITEWNEPVYQALRALYDDQVVKVSILITNLGDQYVLAPVLAVVALWLLWQRRFTAFLVWCGTTGFGILTGAILKKLIDSERPEGLMVFNTEHSFPSGHVLASTLTYGLAAAIIHHSLPPNRRWIPWTIAIPLIFLISFSRLYLGLHWFSDIVGSLSLALVFLSLGIFMYRRFEQDRTPVKMILIPGFISLCIMVTGYSIYTYPKMRYELTREWKTETLDPNQWWQEKDLSNFLYRNGAFKKQATIFDVQWLGSLDSIQAFLEQQDWKKLPKFSYQTSLMVLSDTPSPENLPVLPKFHRDRLPVLIVEKPLPNNDRLLLQLWQSDYVTPEGKPLWLGTLRHEVMKHPVPLVSLYREKSNTNNISNNTVNTDTTNNTLSDTNDKNDILHPLAEELKKSSKFQYKLVDAELSHIMFIQEK